VSLQILPAAGINLSQLPVRDDPNSASNPSARGECRPLASEFAMALRIEIATL